MRDHIDNEVTYTLSCWTYAIAVAHSGLEWLFFGTTKAGLGMWLVLPFPVVSLVWMFVQWNFYVKGCLTGRGAGWLRVGSPEWVVRTCRDGFCDWLYTRTQSRR